MQKEKHWVRLSAATEGLKGRGGGISSGDQGWVWAGGLCEAPLQHGNLWQLLQGHITH